MSKQVQLYKKKIDDFRVDISGNKSKALISTSTGNFSVDYNEMDSIHFLICPIAKIKESKKWYKKHGLKFVLDKHYYNKDGKERNYFEVTFGHDYIWFKRIDKDAYSIRIRNIEIIFNRKELFSLEKALSESFHKACLRGWYD